MRTFAAIAVVVMTLASCGGTKNDAEIDAKLQGLLDNKDFFTLREEFDRSKGALSQERTLYYQVWLDNVFNRCEESNAAIDDLLARATVQSSDSLVTALLALRADNFTRLNRYREAAETYRRLIDRLDSAQDSEAYAGYVNMYGLWSAVADVPPTTVEKPGRDVTIDAARDAFNMLLVPVRSGGVAEKFVFDSGANLSTVPQSVARAMGMRVYNADVTVGTSGAETEQASLAVADSLWFGDVLVRNVVFLLVPDETMTFPQINYAISGVVGFPVMLAMEEVRLQKSGPIHIPFEPTRRTFSNLFMEGLKPHVQLVSGDDALVLSLDTGANRTELSRQYYDRHREAVDLAGRDTVAMRGSAGGVAESREKILTDFPFRIGSAGGVLADIRVALDDYTFTAGIDGNLGQDVLTQFDTMILNFRDMFIDFE